jgi:hypothetical protein
MSEPNLPAGAAAAEPEAAPAGCACTLFAVVRANGTLVRGCNALNADKPDGNGIYRVLFNQNVNNCAWVATIGLPDDGVPPCGQISVAGLANPNGVQVRTFDRDCQPTDRPFHLAVHCCPDDNVD